MKRFEVNPTIIWRMQNEKAVLLQPHTGAITVLNPVGSTIWQLLQSQTGDEEIVSHLVQSYQVTAATARQDLQHYLDVLFAKGLLLPTLSAAQTDWSV